MENNLPIMAKKVWNLVRVAYFLLRKGFSKSKLMLDLNLITKRSKIAGKALTNLMLHLHYHHHHHGGASPSNTAVSFPLSADDYEFSCSNTPAFHLGKIRRNHSHHSFFACAHAPPTLDDDDAATVNAVKAAIDLLNNHGGASSSSPVAAASPALPGFGRTPRKVRQLRVTDSPFPLQDANADPLVDEAADEFITRFYNQLRLQTSGHEN